MQQLPPTLPNKLYNNDVALEPKFDTLLLLLAVVRSVTAGCEAPLHLTWVILMVTCDGCGGTAGSGVVSGLGGGRVCGGGATKAAWA